MPRTVSLGARAPRDPKFKDSDASALYAIDQAAVNVELFTIPLYMGTLNSIQGTHQITAKGQSYFKGRLWPGVATTANPKTANGFNIIFSVFIQEMLHLQLAANMATAIGLTPSFTSPAPIMAGPAMARPTRAFPTLSICATWTRPIRA